MQGGKGSGKGLASKPRETFLRRLCRGRASALASYHSAVTTREKAHALLDHLPEERVDAALAALEAVDGRDTSVEAILARHGEQRLDPREFERQFGSLPTDDEG